MITATAENVAVEEYEDEHASAPWPPIWLCGVHLAALWAITFVQPLFDLLGKDAAFFVARDNTPGDILFLAFGFTLGPPLVALAVLAIVNLISSTAAKVLYLLLFGLLASVLALQIVKGISDSSAVVIPIAVALGGALTFAYTRFAGLRSTFTVLGVAPVVIIALLLFFTPVSDLVFPSDEPRAAAGDGAASNTPVVVMVFDELPAITLMRKDKSVDAKRYPNFARLERSSTFYRNTTSVSDGTYVAVPAILTGLRPKAQLPTSRDYPRNLFTLLGKTYDHHVQEPITSVCPEDLCGRESRPRQKRRLEALAEDLKVVEGRLLLPGDLADDLPPIDRDWGDFAGEAGDDGLAERAAAAEAPPEDASTAAKGLSPVLGNDLPAQRVRAGRAVVRTMKPSRKGALWMVHYVIPHVPWRFLPDGRQYVVDGPTIPGLDDQDWLGNRFLADQGYQRHVLMTKFADNLLGEAIDRMKRTGLWDDALVIVLADHGGAHEPNESRRPVTRENFEAVAGVPMFVKLPGQKKGAVSDTYTTTMDVLPTVAKTLGIDNDWKIDGKPADEPRTEKKLSQRNGREAKLVSLSPQEFVRERDARLARQLRRFPSGNASVWEAGPRPDLLGRAVSGGAPGASMSATIENASLYANVKPGTGVVPAYVAGETRGVAPGTDLAVAVRGRIRATGEAYVEHGDRRFSFMLPPGTLRRGRNRIEVYAVNGGSLRSIARAG